MKWIIAGLAVLLLAGCGGGGSATSGASAAASPSPSPLSAADVAACRAFDRAATKAQNAVVDGEPVIEILLEIEDVPADMLGASEAASEPLAEPMSQAQASLNLMIDKMSSGGKSAGDIATEWDGATEAMDEVQELCEQ